MPELPEIETLKRSLEPLILRRRIERVTVFQPHLRFAVAADFARRCRHQTIHELKRRGKYLLWRMDTDLLLIHCGMAGSLHYHARRSDRRKHDHVIIELSDGFVHYHDSRRFGFMRLISHEHNDTALDTLGKEPLSDDFTADWLLDVCGAQKSVTIKTLLMNQHLIAGLGNIYVCEALYEARIHPARTAKTISGDESIILVDAIRHTLLAAIQSGGSTIRDYRNSMGDTGYFQHQFKVYSRDGESCPRCDAMIVKQKINGRSSFFCPSCQK